MPATLPPVPNSEDQLAAGSPPLELFPSVDGKALEFDFTPAKEPLELNNSCGSSSEKLRNEKGQNSIAANISQKPTDQENAILELDRQEVELPKERIQISALRQNQHLTSEELLVVTETVEECSIGETNTSLQLVQNVLDSSGALEYMCENQSQESTELNICENVPEVLKEFISHDEVSCVGTTEMGADLHTESLTGEEPSKIIALKQHIAILEKQLNNKTEELEQIRVILKQQDKEIKAKERSIEILASSKAQLEEKICWESTKEIKPFMQANCALQYHDAAVNTEIMHEKIEKGASDKGISVSITVPMESVGCGVHGDNVNTQLKEISKEIVHANYEKVSSSVSAGQKNSTFLGVEEGNNGSILEMKNNELKINEYTDNNKYQNEVCQCSMPLSSASVPADRRHSGFGDAKEKGNETVFKTDFKEDLNEEESHPEPMDSPADPSISQYVKKIQDLLQEQWMCLEHGYPELASAIKQPASKLSSIQNQLVNSLNLLLSAYSTQTPTDKENSNTQCQQLGKYY